MVKGVDWELMRRKLARGDLWRRSRPFRLDLLARAGERPESREVARRSLIGLSTKYGPLRLALRVGILHRTLNGLRFQFSCRMPFVSREYLRSIVENQ